MHQLAGKYTFHSVGEAKKTNVSHQQSCHIHPTAVNSVGSLISSAATEDLSPLVSGAGVKDSCRFSLEADVFFGWAGGGPEDDD